MLQKPSARSARGRSPVSSSTIPDSTFARSLLFPADLRHFLRVSVGGTPRKPWTSDTFPAFPSEVPLKSLGPPTLFPRFRRRCPSKALDLRHFPGNSVGGTPQKPWTSDTFPAFLSEVPLESPGSPTLFPHFCRRWAQSKPCEPFGSSSRGLF